MFCAMNSTHRKTLDAIFSNPVPASLEWRKIDALFIALDAQKIAGKGSRVAYVINGVRADFHRPHPGKNARRYQIRAAREFLQLAGVIA